MKNIRYLILLTLIITSLTSCRPLNNGGDTDWATVGFSLEESNRHNTQFSVSGNGVETALIIAVPENTTPVELSRYLVTFFDRQLQDLTTGRVEMRIPLNVSIRLIKVVFTESMTLQEILDSEPAAFNIGISDSFSVTGSDLRLTIVVAMRPLVASTTPADGASSVAVNTSLEISFSKAMDPATITANSSDTSCSGSIQLSSDNFATCVQMGGAPAAGNDDQTFTLTPSAVLPGLTTYRLKVTTTAADKSGQTLADNYTTSSGFTTAPGALTGFWNFVDGNNTDGINKHTTEDGMIPQLTVFNDKLYATWTESYAGVYQARVVEWDGASTWSFVDGDGTYGINKLNTKSAIFPQLTAFNSKLYAAWYEPNSGPNQIRVAEWDGASTWNFVDGNGTDGINYNPLEGAQCPQITVFNDKLYAAWYEENSGVYQVRVAEWDGASTWSLVDGASADGINKFGSEDAIVPQLMVFNDKLYATWQEEYSAVYQIRIAEWNGASTWNFVDGNLATGINKDTGEAAGNPQLATFNSKLYATWHETSAGPKQVRVAEWDGTSAWNFVDGDLATGINKNTGEDAEYARLTVFNGKFYAIWHEPTAGVKQVRVAEWDGSSTWTFVDGGLATGINKDTGLAAEEPKLMVFNSRLYATWHESNGSKNQIRVAEAETE